MIFLLEKTAKLKMKIPKKIKIGGFDYDIILDNLLRKAGNEYPGTHSQWEQKIFISNDQHQQQQEESLIHEIIEAINRGNDLKMEHPTISTLSYALYQVLKDNNLLK